MYREKNVSVRVNSALYERFLNLVESKTRIYNYEVGRKSYCYKGCNINGNRKNIDLYGKYTLSDLLEEALKMYIQNNDTNLKK